MTKRKVPLTVSMFLGDLERLEAFAAKGRLTKGAAIGALLDIASRSLHRDWHQEQDIDPHVGTGDPMAPAARPWSPESELPPPLPLIRSPEEKAAALAALGPLMKTLPQTKGIHEPNRKPDPMTGKDWDE